MFDGWCEHPYRETDPASDLVQGREWLLFERALTRVAPESLLVRTGLILDPERADDPTVRQLAALRAGQTLEIAPLEQLSPLWMPDLVDGALDLLVDAERGVWHLAPRTSCAALDWARRLAAHAGVALAATLPSAGRPVEDPRGPMRALASERGWPAPTWEEALERALAAAPGMRSA